MATIEYDPNRSARIALLSYADGEKRYILQPDGSEGRAEDCEWSRCRHSGRQCSAAANIPPGTQIHNVELKPGKGAQMVRSAGGAAQLVAKEGEYALVKLPSGETRKVLRRIAWRPSGRSATSITKMSPSARPDGTRWLGIVRTNRGVVMNPVDHPHGGGEGKTSGGRHPVTPWGQPTRGYKTRNNKRTDKFIVKRRRQK